MDMLLFAQKNKQHIRHMEDIYQVIKHLITNNAYIWQRLQCDNLAWSEMIKPYFSHRQIVKQVWFYQVD